MQSNRNKNIEKKFKALYIDAIAFTTNEFAIKPKKLNCKPLISRLKKVLNRFYLTLNRDEELWVK